MIHHLHSYKSGHLHFGVRVLIFILALFGFGLSASAAESLYIRPMENEDWSVPAKEEYRLKLVKSEGDLQVYNWTGFFPKAFVIADENFKTCLGSSEPLKITAAADPLSSTPVTLMEDVVGTIDYLISTVGKTDRTAEDLLIVQKQNGEWKSIVVNTARVGISGYIHGARNVEMQASIEGSKVLYECTCDLDGEFRVTIGSKVYNRVAKNGYTTSFVEKDFEYTASIVKGSQMITPDTDVTPDFSNVSVQFRCDLSTAISTLLITDNEVADETGYALLAKDGRMFPFVEGETDALVLNGNPGNDGFVVVAYNGVGAEPTSADITGYYTNKGGVTYYYDEKLTYSEGLPSESDYMLMAEEHPQSREIAFSFAPESSTLRLSCETACEHLPIYFYNTENFAAPHVRAVNSDGRLYTGLSGSAMTQKEVEMFGGDENLWRFDLWIPAEELTAKVNRSNVSRKGAAMAADSDDASTVIVAGKTASGLTPSNLHLTFTDGSTATGDDKQFTNVPLVKGGVYALSEPATTVSTANKLYLLTKSGTAYKTVAVLTQDKTGAYVFDGVLPLSAASGSATIDFFVSTVDASAATTASSDKFYGAPADVTEEDISSALNSSVDSNNFNGTMVNGSERSWVVNTAGLTGDLDVRVHISPDGAQEISFGSKKDDFQTSVTTVSVEDGVTSFFLLNGTQATPSQRGLLIKVTPNGVSKVLVP